jgi:hypothetical protein
MPRKAVREQLSVLTRTTMLFFEFVQGRGDEIVLAPFFLRFFEPLGTLAYSCTVAQKPRWRLRIRLCRTARNHLLAAQLVRRSAAAPRQVALGTEGAPRLRGPTRGHTRPHVRGNLDALAVGVDCRGNNVWFVYGHCVFLPGPPHQK